MKKISFITKMRLRHEAKNISSEDITYSEWLDKDTWVCWGIQWTPKLNVLRSLLDEIFNLPEDITSGDGIIMMEYHLDEKKFWYGLVFDDETITITNLISSEQLNQMILRYILPN